MDKWKVATLHFHVKDLVPGTILRYELAKVQAMWEFSVHRSLLCCMGIDRAN